MYIAPFSKQLWISIIILCVLSGSCVSFALSILESRMNENESRNKYFHEKGFSKIALKLFQWICFSFLSNFGVNMNNVSRLPFQETFVVKLLLMSIFLSANVLFVGYKAALTSELSLRTRKLPFSNWNELAESDFRHDFFIYSIKY